MTRVLPGVYVSLNDLSQIPEGAQSLNVGYVVKANRGPVNEFSLVTSPTDFLTKYTFSGTVKPTDDPTFHSIIKVLAQTNSMYVVRAAVDPLYGGVVIKKAKDYGAVTKVDATAETITITGSTTPEVGEIVLLTGTNKADGYYVVKSVANKVITVTGDITENYTGTAADGAKLVRCPVAPLNAIKIADISATVASGSKITLNGNVAAKFAVGDVFSVRGATATANNKDFTVVSAEFKTSANKTEVVVEESVAAGEDGAAYFGSVTNPDVFANSFGADDLMVITGINPGAYNGKIAFTLTSALDNPDAMVYHKGATGIFDEPCTFDTMQLNVINTETGEQLESFTFSRDPKAKAIDGTVLYVDNVVAGSAYIKVINNTADTEACASTLAGVPVQASGGSDGSAVTPADLVKALTVFEDKTVPISILGNGCSAEAESALFQQALVQLAVTRKDCMVFLNSRKEDEKATLPSTRAANIVDYKKNTLGSASFYGCMYAPHVTTADVFNSRDVEIGAESVAIAGWLNVLENLRYPYAYAGPRNGLVSGVVCNWKIGDMSGEAESLNDASVNYVAYDGRVGRYYMQCQNTLQVANSSLRNIGAVLNVLDIKETLATNLKEYIQLPITDQLRRDIVTTANDYLAPMAGTRLYNYAFQDITTDADVADNTLRFLLTLSLTAYAQRIYLAINIVRASFDFSILQSA
jgi:hypothetical protein